MKATKLFVKRRRDSIESHLLLPKSFNMYNNPAHSDVMNFSLHLSPPPPCPACHMFCNGCLSNKILTFLRGGMQLCKMCQFVSNCKGKTKRRCQSSLVSNFNNHHRLRPYHLCGPTIESRTQSAKLPSLSSV